MMADVSALIPYESDRPGSQLLWMASWRGGEPRLPRVHVHPGLEVGVVIAGMEEMHYINSRVSCNPGQAWLCNAWEPHGPIATPSRLQSVVMVFAPEFIGEEMLGEIPWLTLFAMPPEQRPQSASSGGRRRVLTIAHRLRREVEEGQRRWRAMVRILLMGLLLELLREWDEEGLPEPSAHATPTELARVMPAVSLVHSLPWRRVGVSEAAAACGLSRSRFHDVFERALGVSFGAFCLRARLSFAANRLLHTDRAVSDVAIEAGFLDSSHFRRRFAILYGCTPSGYRKQRRSGPT
jgi:AraC-like DNA-binding protein